MFQFMAWSFGITLSGFSLVGPGVLSGVAAVFTTCAEVTVASCLITNWEWGILAEHASSVLAFGNSISTVTFGVEVWQGATVVFGGAASITSASQGIYINSGRASVASGPLVISNTGTGVVCNPSGGVGVYFSFKSTLVFGKGNAANFSCPIGNFV